MPEQIRWQELTREQRNLIVAQTVMNAARVRDTSLLPDQKQTIPDYSTNLNEACLILLTFKQTALSYQTQRDLAHIDVKIDEIEISFRGGSGEECTEAICIAALRAVGADVQL